MKFFAGVLSFALLASSAVASPTPGKGKGHGDKDCKWYKDGKEMKFSSTYSVIATPGQVVNGTEPTGGLPVSTFVFSLSTIPEALM